VVTIQNWDHTTVFSRGGNGEYLTFWYIRQIPDGAVSRACFPVGWGVQISNIETSVAERSQRWELEWNSKRTSDLICSFKEALEKIAAEVIESPCFGNCLEGVADESMTLRLDRGELSNHHI